MDFDRIFKGNTSKADDYSTISGLFNKISFVSKFLRKSGTISSRVRFYLEYVEKVDFDNFTEKLGITTLEKNTAKFSDILDYCTDMYSVIAGNKGEVANGTFIGYNEEVRDSLKNKMTSLLNFESKILNLINDKEKNYLAEINNYIAKQDYLENDSQKTYSASEASDLGHVLMKGAKPVVIDKDDNGNDLPKFTSSQFAANKAESKEFIPRSNVYSELDSKDEIDIFTANDLDIELDAEKEKDYEYIKRNTLKGLFGEEIKEKKMVNGKTHKRKGKKIIFNSGSDSLSNLDKVLITINEMNRSKVEKLQPTKKILKSIKPISKKDNKFFNNLEKSPGVIKKKFSRKLFPRFWNTQVTLNKKEGDRFVADNIDMWDEYKPIQKYIKQNKEQIDAIISEIATSDLARVTFDPSMTDKVEKYLSKSISRKIAALPELNNKDGKADKSIGVLLTPYINQQSKKITKKNFKKMGYHKSLDKLVDTYKDAGFMFDQDYESMKRIESLDEFLERASLIRDFSNYDELKDDEHEENSNLNSESEPDPKPDFDPKNSSSRAEDNNTTSNSDETDNNKGKPDYGPRFAPQTFEEKINKIIEEIGDDDLKDILKSYAEDYSDNKEHISKILNKINIDDLTKEERRKLLKKLKQKSSVDMFEEELSKREKTNNSETAKDASFESGRETASPKKRGMKKSREIKKKSPEERLAAYLDYQIGLLSNSESMRQETNDLFRGNNGKYIRNQFASEKSALMFEISINNLKRRIIKDYRENHEHYYSKTSTDNIVITPTSVLKRYIKNNHIYKHKGKSMSESLRQILEETKPMAEMEVGISKYVFEILTNFDDDSELPRYVQGAKSYLKPMNKSHDTQQDLLAAGETLVQDIMDYLLKTTLSDNYNKISPSEVVKKFFKANPHYVASGDLTDTLQEVIKDQIEKLNDRKKSDKAINKMNRKASLYDSIKEEKDNNKQNYSVRKVELN